MAKTRNYNRDNTEAARTILADPAKYDGLLLIWAELWTAPRNRAKEARIGLDG